MTDGYLTYEEVLERLKARAQALGSQVLLAKEAGVSYQLLNDVIHRRSKRLGPKLLAGLGLREVVLYAPFVEVSGETPKMCAAVEVPEVPLAGPGLIGGAGAVPNAAASGESAGGVAATTVSGG